MTQIQIHKKPPAERSLSNPWPERPRLFEVSSSQQEGCERIFSHLALKVVGSAKVEGLEIEEIVWPEGEIKSGMRNFSQSGKRRTLPCDLLLVALGFTHTSHNQLLAETKVALSQRGNVEVQQFVTNQPKIYAAGDMVEGANLVVTAINSGQKMALAMIKKLQESL